MKVLRKRERGVIDVLFLYLVGLFVTENMLFKGCFLLYTYERNRSILSTHLSVQNALLVRLATEVKVCTLDAVEGPLDSKPFKLEKSREEWGVGEKRFLFSRRARALLRFDAYTCVGFFYGTTRVLYCFVFLSLVLIYYIAALYSSFFSRSKETVVSKPISSLFDFLSFTKKTRSSSRRRRRAWCSLRLLFLLFLFCLFVVGLQTSSFHSFRPFHRRQKDPFSNDRHAFEPRTFLPRPMRQSFPPLA